MPLACWFPGWQGMPSGVWMDSVARDKGLLWILPQSLDLPSSDIHRFCSCFGGRSILHGHTSPQAAGRLSYSGMCNIWSTDLLATMAQFTGVGGARICFWTVWAWWLWVRHLFSSLSDSFYGYKFIQMFNLFWFYLVVYFFFLKRSLNC